MDGDGDIEYSRYTLDELRQAEASINSVQYPKNYANLTTEMEARLAEQARVVAEQKAKRAANPLEISGKTAEFVISEYELTLGRAKVVSVIAVLLWLPNLLDRFVDFERHLGLDSTVRLWLSALGVAIYGLFGWLYWNCPNCGKFPGGGWRRSDCRSCGVSLRATVE